MAPNVRHGIEYENKEPLHNQIRIRRAHRSMATKLEREAIQLLSKAEEPGGDDRICRLETITELLDSKLKELKVFDGLTSDLLEDKEKLTETLQKQMNMNVEFVMP